MAIENILLNQEILQISNHLNREIKQKERFKEAGGGTLFLDKIAEMPLMIQPKFLRAIQEGEGKRLGSNKLIRYNFRIISAANKNLFKEVEEGRFGKDLFYRTSSVD